MIDYDESWMLKVLLQRRGSVIPRALLFALPAACAAVMILYLETLHPDLRMESGIDDLVGSQVYAACTGVTILMVSFRTSQALSRFWEGTSLLHQMRGEWFDSVSCLIAFTRSAIKDKPREVMEFRHTLVRLMSLCHRSALEEIADSDGASGSFEVIDIGGLDAETLAYLHDCEMTHKFNRVEVILHMMQVLITCALDESTLRVAPPILSRVYQTLSRGLVNLLNATKIKNTRFPFPYAQLVTVLILALALWTPLLVTSLLKSYWMAAGVTFLPVFGTVCLNLIAIQLEMPFGNDLNDLPLESFQDDMNRGLLLLLSPGSDIRPTISLSCKLDFDDICAGGFVRMSVGESVTDDSRDAKCQCDVVTSAAPEWTVAGESKATTETQMLLSSPTPHPPPAPASPSEPPAEPPVEPDSSKVIPDVISTHGLDMLEALLQRMTQASVDHIQAVRQNTFVVMELCAEVRRQVDEQGAAEHDPMQRDDGRGCNGELPPWPEPDPAAIAAAANFTARHFPCAAGITSRM